MSAAPLDHPLLADHAALLDRYVELLREDQALRHAEYDRPDPKRRRLRVACNDCQTPWCCNQRVVVDFVEALAIYRFARLHVPRFLEAALKRGAELHRKPPLDDVEFFRRRATCPFLERGECTIFAVRPQRCRSHYMGGNPMKCRDELQPKETYEMNPDRRLLAELETVAEEVRFRSGVTQPKRSRRGGDPLPPRPEELTETLLFIDQLLRRPPWSGTTSLDWSLVE